MTLPLPHFTDDEQFLIKYIKSPSAVRASDSYMWGYLIGGAIVAGFAAYHNNISMMVVAFATVCAFRIYEELFQRKYIPLWRSIIDKYEAGEESKLCDGARSQPLDRDGMT